MPTQTAVTYPTQARPDAHGTGKGKAKPNQKLVGRLLRMASATERLPDGRAARIQRPEVVAAVNKIMTGLFPGVDLAVVNGGFLDERELGRYERGEVFWPSRYRRAAFRAFFNVASDADLGFYRARVLEPVLDDDEQADGVTPSEQPGDRSSSARSHDALLSGQPGPAQNSDTRGGDTSQLRRIPPPRTGPATTAVAGGGTAAGDMIGGRPQPRPWRPNRLDVSKPHSARRYDYWLGGKDNFPADRESGDAIEQRFPWVRTAALANRAFLGRAVRAVAQAGVRQFLDIGTGLPAPGNTHEIAQRITPDARVLYVDNDPIVGTHSRALTVGNPAGRIGYLEADLGRPEQILQHPDLPAILNLREPLGIVLAAVLHYVPDLAEAQRAVRALLDAAAPGSFLIISHGTHDFMCAEDAAAYETMYAAGDIDVRTRTRDQIATFVASLQIVEPGLVAVSDWRPDDELAKGPTAGHVGLYGVVGHLGPRSTP
ncbi:SAM-dependent methyltransferase [Actinoplanes sp. G11-F43]|uniref:SAM-dependent methyltransferase n=1 Tax=Actinoplanes sp. G11-F43 TaxID=3424130 RepID=UPI003D332494